MFATDRDLLAQDPEVFREVLWATQRRVRGTATLSGTALIFSTQDVGLDAAGVDAGHVVSLNGDAYEVIARTGTATLTVSRLRDSLDAPAIPGGSVSSPATAVVATFRPQIALVHDQVLRMLGLAEAEGPNEQSVVDPSALREVEALGALHLVWAGAAALSGPDSPPGKRAEWFRRRFAAARRSAVVALDLDGDGAADATRRLSALHVMRV